MFALAGLVVTALLGITAVMFATSSDAIYGMGIFIALPIVSGFVGTLIWGWRGPITRGEAMKMSAMALTASGFGLLGMKIEGIICLFMAAPLAYPLALLGGSLAFSVLDHVHGSKRVGTTMLLAILLPFGAIQWERVFPSDPPTYAVTSTIDIAAPQEKVWNALVHPYQVRRTEDLVFYVGVAYPRAAWIEGTGTNATRFCDFSTGTFVEPIREWRENELLRFEVAKNVPAMQEWNPSLRFIRRILRGFWSRNKGSFA